MNVEPQQSRTDQLSLFGEEKAALRPSQDGEAGSQSVGIGERQASPLSEGNRALETEPLMERICELENLNRAYKRVRWNRGSPGIDGMNVADLAPWIEAQRRS